MTNAPLAPIQRINTLLSGLLDRGYARQVAPVLRALSSDPRLASALDAFNKEAARLEAAKLPLTADNPALLNVRRALETAMNRQTARIDTAGQALQQGAVAQAGTAARQLALPGMGNQHLQAIGVEWNHPNPDAIARLVNYAQSTAWNDQLDKFGAGMAERINQLAIAGIVDGQNPREIARMVTQGVEAVPRYEAEKMLRTLQLTSYRQASAANYAANDDIIDYLVRIEALDDRICISCVALHGTRLEVGESVDEHWNGRGVAIPVVRGFSRDIQSGEDWFNDLSADRQRAIMGGAAHNAWTAGEVNLNDFVEHTTDPVFGDMIREASLTGVLGDNAKQFYVRNYDR